MQNFESTQPSALVENPTLQTFELQKPVDIRDFEQRLAKFEKRLIDDQFAMNDWNTELGYSETPSNKRITSINPENPEIEAIDKLSTRDLNNLKVRNYVKLFETHLVVVQNQHNNTRQLLEQSVTGDNLVELTAAIEASQQRADELSTIIFTRLAVDDQNNCNNQSGGHIKREGYVTFTDWEEYKNFRFAIPSKYIESLRSKNRKLIMPIFYNGLYPITAPHRTEHHGFVDTSGKLFPIQRENTLHFSPGVVFTELDNLIYAQVTNLCQSGKGNSWYIITPETGYLRDPNEDEIFYNDIRIYPGLKFGKLSEYENFYRIDPNNKPIITESFKEIKEFEGQVFVMSLSGWHKIDVDGNLTTFTPELNTEILNMVKIDEATSWTAQHCRSSVEGFNPGRELFYEFFVVLDPNMEPKYTPERCFKIDNYQCRNNSYRDQYDVPLTRVKTIAPGLEGYLNTNYIKDDGTLLFPDDFNAKYDVSFRGYNFYDGLLRIKNNRGRYNYINTDGTLLFPTFCVKNDERHPVSSEFSKLKLEDGRIVKIDAEYNIRDIETGEVINF